jgi:hypothetical protein
VPLPPQLLGNRYRIGLVFRPPDRLVAGIVQLAVMPGAERHHPLVTDLASERSWLGEAQVMRL